MEDPKGVTCKCGVYKAFSDWVIAHWDERITYTCECGKQYTVIQGAYAPKARRVRMKGKV